MAAGSVCSRSCYPCLGHLTILAEHLIVNKGMILTMFELFLSVYDMLAKCPDAVLRYGSDDSGEKIWASVFGSA